MLTKAYDFQDELKVGSNVFFLKKDFLCVHIQAWIISNPFCFKQVPIERNSVLTAICMKYFGNISA